MKIIKPFEYLRYKDQFTKFYNPILDTIMPKCKPNTWKVLCVTIRQTVGYQYEGGGHKKEDQISYSQFQKKTGIKGRDTLAEALRDALKNKYIVRKKKGNQDFVYSLNYDYEIQIKDNKTSTENELV